MIKILLLRVFSRTRFIRRKVMVLWWGSLYFSVVCFALDINVCLELSKTFSQIREMDFLKLPLVVQAGILSQKKGLVILSHDRAIFNKIIAIKDASQDVIFDFLDFETQVNIRFRLSKYPSTHSDWLTRSTRDWHHPTSTNIKYKNLPHEN